MSNKWVDLSSDEVLDRCEEYYLPHGNDIDLLNRAMALVLAGHYQEAIEFAIQVQPEEKSREKLPDKADKSAAQAAFISAAKRARPLFEQAAREIEGQAEGSRTMMHHDLMLDSLREDPNW